MGVGRERENKRQLLYFVTYTTKKEKHDNFVWELTFKYTISVYSLVASKVFSRQQCSASEVEVKERWQKVRRATLVHVWLVPVDPGASLT